jgi:cellulose synthase/poly-beta-1,6-N-acetylglucosamine synthase-like glycosyltransferase
MTAVVAAVGWLAGLALFWRVPRLPAPPADRSTPHQVSVVVPARDEELRLPRLLASLTAQTEPPLEVLVVDDGSTDRTGELASAAGATVVRTAGPPEGWTGKTWACELGCGQAGGDLLVVLDADTWLADDALERLAAAHDAQAAGGLLSVLPFHVTRRLHEQLSAICNTVAVLASGAGLQRGANARVAFGPCLVTTPGALAAAGGFASVRGDVVEDLALARRYRAARRPVRCLLDAGAVSYRMYPDGLGALVEGWTKNLSSGARRAPTLPALGATAWVTGALAVAVATVTTPSPAVAVAWVAYAGQLRWMLVRLGSFQWWSWAVFPVTVSAFVALVTSSAVARGIRRQVTWRGRRIAVGRT